MLFLLPLIFVALLFSGMTTPLHAQAGVMPPTGVTILSDTTPGTKTLQVSSIVADLPPPVVLPDWLGTKPPVDGDWFQTLDEEFAGNAIDPHRWNVHPDGNWWDKRMHFSKDEVIVQDGFLHCAWRKKADMKMTTPRRS